MYTFIVNPNARSGRGSEVWKQLEAVLKERNIPYDIRFTKYQKHATKIVRELTSDGKEHTIIMLGGDGTVNEIVNGIHDPAKVSLGYIPIGSSNDFARFFGFSKDPLQALDEILACNDTCPLNIGYITYGNGKKTRFAVSSGAGFDAAVCHQSVISKIKGALNKLHLGRLTYVGIALTQLLALEPGTVYVTLDDGERMCFEKTYFATAMNHPFEGGGFKFCPDADPCDDKLNVTVISGLSKLKVLFLLPTAFKGWHTRFKGVYTYTCDKVVIESEHALPLHTDGEPVPHQKRVEATLEPAAVKLLYNKTR